MCSRWWVLLAWLPAALMYFVGMLFVLVAALGDRRQLPAPRRGRGAYGTGAVIVFLCSFATAGIVLFELCSGEPWLALMLAGWSSFFLLSFILRGALARVAEHGDEVRGSKHAGAAPGQAGPQASQGRDAGSETR